jgi:hypothetical protein
MSLTQHHFQLFVTVIVRLRASVTERDLHQASCHYSNFITLNRELNTDTYRFEYLQRHIVGPSSFVSEVGSIKVDVSKRLANCIPTKCTVVSTM